jgi:hypothetical protein
LKSAIRNTATFVRGDRLSGIHEPIHDVTVHGGADGGVSEFDAGEALRGLGIRETGLGSIEFFRAREPTVGHVLQAFEARAEVLGRGLGLLQPEPVFVGLDLQEGLALRDPVALLGEDRLHHARHPSEDVGLRIGLECRIRGVGARDRAADCRLDGHRHGRLVRPVALSSVACVPVAAVLAGISAARTGGEDEDAQRGEGATRAGHCVSKSVGFDPDLAGSGARIANFQSNKEARTRRVTKPSLEAASGLRFA